MSIELKPWDAAEYLRTPEDLAGYIELVLEEDRDSPAMMAHTLALAARVRGGVVMLAEESGISRDHLSQAIEHHDDSCVTILEHLQHTYRMLAEAPKVA